MRASSFLWVLSQLERHVRALALSVDGTLLVITTPKLAAWCSSRLDLARVSFLDASSPLKDRSPRGNTRRADRDPRTFLKFQPVVSRPPRADRHGEAEGAAGLLGADDALDLRSWERTGDSDLGERSSSVRGLREEIIAASLRPLAFSRGLRRRLGARGAGELSADHRRDKGDLLKPLVRRCRSMRPELLDSESLGRCSFGAQNLFGRLVLISDDVGRFRARPEYVASVCFPHQRKAQRYVKGWLSELSREGIVSLYVVGLDAYGCFPKWLDHQKVDHSGPSKYPGPDSLARPREDSRDATVGEEGNGVERNGVDRKGDDAPPATPEKSESVTPTLFDDGAVKRSLGAHRDNPGVHGWFEFQKRRRAQGFDVVERPPKPEKFDDLWSLWLEMREKSPHLESGGEDAGIWALVDLFFADAFWKAKSCPWNGFASQWSDYAAKYKAAHR